MVASPEDGGESMPVDRKDLERRLALCKDSDTSRGLTSGKVDCTVALGGRTQKVSGEVTKGTASCTVRVPRNAVVVRGSMVVRALGKSVTAWFAGAIGFGGGTD